MYDHIGVSVVLRATVIIWHIEIYLDSIVYLVVLGEYIKADLPLVYYIVNSIAQAWKSIF